MAPPQAEASASATASNQSGTDAPCYLLDLPPELRLMIYEELLAATKPGFDADPALFGRLEPAFMLTCKFIRGEMLLPYLDHLDIMHEEVMEEATARMVPFQGYKEEDNDNTTVGFWDAFNDLNEWVRDSILVRQRRLIHAQLHTLIETDFESAEAIWSEMKAVDEKTSRDLFSKIGRICADRIRMRWKGSV